MRGTQSGPHVTCRPYVPSAEHQRPSGRDARDGLAASVVTRPASVASETMSEDVVSANDAFYDAHERRDLDAMRQVWEHSSRVVCVHPGWPILRGWPAVEESWRRILGGPGRNQFILTNSAITVHGDVAWVTVDENLVAGSTAGTIAATNMYVRDAQGWKLVLHHGSPVVGS